ncbi:MAG: hypothetical protein FWD24_00140 [Treponema sp.]|nr:hypothetical protein [Treponema sp.]
MNKKLKVVFLFSLLFSFFFFLLYAEPTNYTYNYDFWEEQVASPDAYRVTDFILGSSLGIGHFRDPQGLFIRENRVFVCDSGNNRVVVLELQPNGEHTVERVITSVLIDGEESNLAYPSDLFQCRSNYIYIADTNNRRILKLDSEWNHIFTITRPDDESIDEFVEFHPLKLVVDFANRIFVQVRNVNKGLMEFDNRGDFTGYMGANKVTFSIVDYIWRLFATQAQRERMNLFIPTEYNNIALDKDGFIYATNATMAAWGDVPTDPVRRLNAMGQDILIRNGYENPVGDLVFGDAAGVSGPSRFVDVVAFDNDSYACFDSARGRIFMYDFQGNLLYAFGSLGNKEGYFQIPVAIDRMGTALYTLDSRTAAVTRFDLTSYGQKINDALNEYRAGRYESSAVIWEEVLKMNGNYDLAYIGIGRAALRQGQYRKAMEYYKLKHFREGYGKAFQLYRKQWMEDNLWKILLIVALVVLVPTAIKYSIKLVKEIRDA